MQCLILVKFLPEGSLPAEEFFARIHAQWSWVEDTNGTRDQSSRFKERNRSQSPRSAVGIADYESIEQLAFDLAIMPGAGISNVEVMPIVSQAVAYGAYATVS